MFTNESILSLVDLFTGLEFEKVSKSTWVFTFCVCNIVLSLYLITLLSIIIEHNEP